MNLRKSVCPACFVECSMVNCACICSCYGIQYANCLVKSSEKSNLFKLNGNTRFKHCSKCSNTLNCLNCISHLECKKCKEFRCSCLDNKISSNNSRGRILNRIDYRPIESVERNSITSTNSIKSTNSNQKKLIKNFSDLKRLNLLAFNPFLIKKLDKRQKLKEAKPYFEKDKNLKQSISRLSIADSTESIDRKLLNSNAIKQDLEKSMKTLRNDQETNKKLNEKSIEKFNYELDNQLNLSLKKQFSNSEESSNSSDGYEVNREILAIKGSDVNADQKSADLIEDCDIGKFELFTYLSLSQCNLNDKKIEQIYPEFKVQKTIRNLIVFVNTKSVSNEHLVKSSLRMCLQNKIDSIQLAGNQKVTNLFTIELGNWLLLRYLTFLVLTFNENLIEPIHLQINELIALRHLELYGTKFDFKKNKCNNETLVNLIIHDKLIGEDAHILDLFPNLNLIKIQNSIGNILKSNSKKAEKLIVICIPNLSFDDLVYLVNNCEKVEFIECTFISIAMIEHLKSFAYLKFIFLNFRKDQYKLSRSLAYSIYYSLCMTSNDLLHYSNQLYCPKEQDKSSINSPCFKKDCANCSSVATRKWSSVQILNENLFKKNLEKNSKKVSKKFVTFLDRFKSKSKELNDKPDTKQNLLKPTEKDLRKHSLNSLESFDRFLSGTEKDLNIGNKREEIKNAGSQSDSNKLCQRVVYLNGIKLCDLNLDEFEVLAEIEKLNYIKISEFNKLFKLISFDMMKEKLFRIEFIEVDEPIKNLSVKESKKLSRLISYSTGLIVKHLDLLTIEYLIRQMQYIKSIQIYNIKIDKQLSNYLDFEFKEVLKKLNRFEMFYYKKEIKDIDLKFLLNCESLDELRLGDFPLNIDDMVAILSKNAYCSKVELSLTSNPEIDKRKIAEVLQINASNLKNLNFDVCLAKNQNLTIDLLSNLKIKF